MMIKPPQAPLLLEKALPINPNTGKITMISFMRTASVAPGKTRDALAFAHKIVKLLSQKQGMKVDILLPVGGNPNRIGWHTMYASLGDLEATITKLMLDSDYMGLIADNAANLLPGSTHDDIWRTI